MSELSGFLAAKMGLHFPDERRMDLERGLRGAAAEFQYTDVEACVRWLLSSDLSPSQIEILAGNLTVGETYFYREPRTFQVLEEHVLPELARQRKEQRRLRIWSAACCSGEEPYSLAIALQKAVPDLTDWQVTIRGTDINPRFLRKASAGVFTGWSFRNAPVWLQNRYFLPAGHGRWEIVPDIKRMVSFSHLNLAEDVYPSLNNDTNALDVIFCRNVLIYFSPAQAARVVERLCHCLTEGGWLVLGPSETSHVQFPGLVPVNFDGAILHQKECTRKAQPTLHTPQPPLLVPEVFEPSPPATRAPAPAAWATMDLVEDETAQPPPPSHDHARLLYEQGRYREAAETLTTLCGTPPVDPRTRPLLARTLANLGDLRGALAWCDQAVAADKLDPVGHYLRASILLELADPEEAKAAFNRALYLDPEFALAHFALANLERNRGKAREAGRHLRQAFDLACARPLDEILPESDGITAGRLKEIILALMTVEEAA